MEKPLYKLYIQFDNHYNDNFNYIGCYIHYGSADEILNYYISKGNVKNYKIEREV